MEEGFAQVARAVFPGGYRRFRHGECEPPPPEGTLVVVEIRNGRPPTQHWWQCNDTMDEGVNVLFASMRVLERGGNGVWYTYVRDAASKKGESIRVVAKHGPSTEKNTTNCITPASSLPPRTTTTAQPTGPLVIFGSQLRGPAGVAAKPQELALRVLHESPVGSKLVAFDMDWRIKGVKASQGFFVVRSWQYFADCILHGTRTKKLRNFYECIANGVRVRFYIDFDGTFAAFPSLRNLSDHQVVDILLDCIERAFCECYPHEQMPLTRADLCVLESIRPGEKFSFHIIGSSGRFAWMDAACLATFVAHVRKLAFLRLLGRELRVSDAREALVDMSMYDKWKKFRTLEATKVRGEHYLRIFQVSGCWCVRAFEETLACMSDDVPADTRILGALGSRFVLALSAPSYGEQALIACLNEHHPNLRVLRAESAAVFVYNASGVDQMPLEMHPHELLPLAGDPCTVAWRYGDGALPTEYVTQPRAPRATACDASRLEHNVELCNFLMPHAVAPGAAHNVRWTRLVTDHRFLLTPAQLALLPAAMAASHACPMMLHEAPASAHVAEQQQRFAVDLDGLPAVVPIAHAIETIARAAGILHIECHVAQAPPKPDAIDMQRAHLVFQCSVPAASAVRRAVLQRIKLGCPPEWDVDAKFSSLRTLGSDKLNDDTGLFANRTLFYAGCWVGAERRSSPATLEARYECCSLIVGVERLPALPLTAEEEKLADGDADYSSSSGLVVTAEQREAMRLEAAAVHGVDTRFSGSSSFKRFGRYVAVNTTNIKLCHYCEREHSKRKQSARFFARRWEEYCWNDDAQAMPRISHPYRDARTVELLQPLFAQPAPDPIVVVEDGPGDDGPALPFDALKERVLRLVPGDRTHWDAAASTWMRGGYFGPRSDTAYGFDYRWSVFALLRRTKSGPRQPVSCEVFALPDGDVVPPVQGVQFDAALGRALLEACREEYGSLGCLDVERDRIDFYSRACGAPVGTLHFHGAKAVYVDESVDPPARRAATAQVARACRAFKASTRLLPLDLDALALQEEARWRALLDPATDSFVLDRGGPRDHLNLALLEAVRRGDDDNAVELLIGPPGCAKTTSIIESGFKGDVVTSSRALSRNLAARFGSDHYMDSDGDVRGAGELAAAQEQLTWVINSIRKVTNRKISALFIDEVTAVMHAIAGGTMRTTGPVILDSLIAKCAAIPRGERLIAASADITPALEGRFFKRELRRPLRVLYKVRGPSAAAMRCRELGADSELWDAYVRVLLHNDGNPLRLISVFFPCSAVADVEHARVLCARYWPRGIAEGRCVFLHAATPMPDGFVENPNDTWTRYAIVCVSTTLKVGVSFEREHYFHLILAFARTGCGCAEDFAQLIQRVRALAQLFLYRVRMQGGAAPPNGNLTAEEKAQRTEAELERFAEPRHINRALLPAPAAQFAEQPRYEWLRAHVEAHMAHDQAHFLEKVRHDLRRRQMTIELGGVAPDETIAVGDRLLAPLPAKTDLSGPNQKQERIERILAAHDISKAEKNALFAKKRQRTLDEEAQLERYTIRKLYREGGPLSFEQLVERHVRDRWDEKVRKCAVVMSTLPDGAAGLDEGQLRFCAQPAQRQYAMLERDANRRLLSTMPDFEPDTFLHGDERAAYRVTLKRLRDEGGEDRILAAQDAIIAASDGMTRSTARTAVKRIVNQFNSVAKSMGLPQLRPSEDERGKKNRKRSRVVVEWALEDTENPPPVFFYAGIRTAGPAAAVVAAAAAPEEILIDDPVIGDAYVEDPATRARYALEPIADDMLIMRVTPPARLSLDAFRASLVHFILTHMESESMVVVVEALPLSVDWEPFRRNMFYRIVFPRFVQERLLFVLRDFFKLAPHHDNVLRASHAPLPVLPTLCRRARVRLVRMVGGVWRFEDVSEYY